MHNILIFCHGYATQFIDINNQYTKLFDPEKFNVTVVYLTGIEDEEIRKRHTAKEVLFLNCSKKSVRGLKIQPISKLLKLHETKNFKIVITHRFKPTYIMLWVSFLRGIPVLISVMHELGTMKSWSRRLIIRLLAKPNNIFAGVSDAVRDDLRKYLSRIPTKHIITLHNSFDIEPMEKTLLNREDARKELGLNSEDFVFGNIGRLAKNKDQKTLIHAFAQAKRECPNSKLIILGDGALLNELKKEAYTLNVKNDVIFTGFITQAYRYIKALDAFVLTSIQEAFGMVLLEAMVGKIPIIATETNGIPEVLGDSGVLIPKAQPVQLAREMQKMYDASHQHRKELGKKGYERALKYFSLTAFKNIFWQLPLIKKQGLL